MLNNEKVLRILSDYPEKLLQEEQEQQKLKEYIDTLSKRLKLIAARVEGEILADSKQEEWKEKLSNANKRELEKNYRLELDDEHQSLQEELINNEKDYIIKTALLKHDERVWQGAKAAAYIMSNR